MKRFDKENIRYLSEVIIPPEKMEVFLRIYNSEDNEDVTPEEGRIFDKVKYYLNTMESYGDNKWWLSKNEDVLAYYQMHAKVLLVKMETFEKALETLLARPVFYFDILMHNKDLIEEADKIFKAKHSEESKKANEVEEPKFN